MYSTEWLEVLCPTRHKIGHFGDVLPSQSLGVVLKKLNLTQQKQITQEQNSLRKNKNAQLLICMRIKNITGAIWWTLTKERQTWFNLQVKLCDPCLSASGVCVLQMALYKYSCFPFLSFQHKIRKINNSLKQHKGSHAFPSAVWWWWTKKEALTPTSSLASSFLHIQLPDSQRKRH